MCVPLFFILLCYSIGSGTIISHEWNKISFYVHGFVNLDNVTLVLTTSYCLHWFWRRCWREQRRGWIITPFFLRFESLDFIVHSNYLIFLKGRDIKTPKMEGNTCWFYLHEPFLYEIHCAYVPLMKIMNYSVLENRIMYKHERFLWQIYCSIKINMCISGHLMEFISVR